MAVQVSYPGVYIDEFEPAAPIEGVGTSVAAFLGSCPYGTPMKPKLITSWDGFQAAFPWPEDGPEDDDYLWYAVRGFFANGGKICFVVAVSNATPDAVKLKDEDGVNDTIAVSARRTGQSSPPISVITAATNVVTGVEIYPALATNKASGATGTKKLTLASAADAAAFVAGDSVVIDPGGADDPAVIERVSGNSVFLKDVLQNDHANVTLRLAQLVPFAKTFRVTGAAGLVPGSIVTVSQVGGPASKTTTVTAVRAQRLTPMLTTYEVTVKDGLNGFTLYAAKKVTIQSEEFDVTVKQGATPAQPTYPGLSMNPAHPRYFASVINDDPNGLLKAEPITPNSTGLPKNRPTAGTFPLLNGVDHNAALIKSRTKDYEDALALIEGIPDVNMVAAPDRTDQGVQGAVLDHCFRLHDRFAIFDAAKGTPLDQIEAQRSGLENDKGFGALYYPWIEVVSEKTGRRILVPPSGHVAGIYARTDLNRGVFKAPAGTEAVISGAVGVEFPFTDTDQGFVNLKGINVIRVFQHGGRPVVWGARTTSADTNWQYVNIRRLFLFLEESIQRGIRGAVFEPNNTSLWQRLKRTITAFLTQQWRDGALFGAKVEEAFYVRIDEVLNPDSERALGRLHIEIGVRPSYPAEFIIVRIGIWQGGSDVGEG